MALIFYRKSFVGGVMILKDQKVVSGKGGKKSTEPANKTMRVKDKGKPVTLDDEAYALKNNGPFLYTADEYALYQKGQAEKKAAAVAAAAKAKADAEKK